ncbi:MAG: saccharopine dehydrogenase NADP-binding domain-containing protein [Rhizobiales bacterium]|nr:saccharopine dehydrogenase NADP-binding domain-containing protein [Hyphomicrobiales bacterium]MBO6699229.1 saccharopine dehydrogenase NADP-binding domain-containing protein [Hyphomicrobiales bacterium]MBO6736767.1 saccharopine dehydrogenase NADP-binding domain-containing protein [Hyphomicrobiales bacterium]MBO6912159.1 saccharopine dehydrogenase NADP-binding domain-containing protein [Hyphomicrobiales bacterium]MBO6956993.1 saccharopine dehydrogenase NADP-binding domain-containing protein [H
MAKRQHDIVLWGATGATGRRAAHHLARRCKESGLRLAIGGRNPVKLEAVRNDLPDAGRGIEVLLGDSHDAAFMDALAKQTRVVASTVGPFALYGSALVAACVANGTHYCDLTAEPQWMRAMIDTHQLAARKTGARIVHACGHDSIPSDLGVQFLQESALARHGQPCKRVATRVTRMKGGFSGGTAASFLNAMRVRETDPEFGRLSQDPYALCPESQRQGPDGPDLMMPIEVTWDAHLNAWTKPYFMGPMNAKVVRRTNAILGYPYGRDFRYEETGLTRAGIGGWAAAARDTVFGRLFLTAMAIPATRKLLQRHVLPKPGEGPSKEVREGGSYELVLVGELPDETVLMARITGQGDPGVRSTTLMLTEAALCLAEDGGKIAVGGGFWTPAAAMGELLRERIREHAGLTFEILADQEQLTAVSA